MSECNPVKTPGEIQKKKTNYLINKEEIDNRFYREVIGALMYLVVGTRPDIANTVSRLAQFVNEPCQQDWLAVKRILRYLAGTLKLGIFYTKKDKSMIGYCDADWGGCLEDRRSYSGYVFILAGGCWFAPGFVRIRLVNGMGIESGTVRRIEIGTRIKIEGGYGTEIEKRSKVEDERRDSIRIKSGTRIETDM
ncbi:Copia protein [Eumeta japonica]|uniref:Copia protein n=1 Tax=Eumeta variegata TaxID=151549 RepID=A0A4C1WQ73_EUMVA|nr:Copia protein [Eumeta japonica]